jgi:hypothetical protein
VNDDDEFEDTELDRRRPDRVYIQQRGTGGDVTVNNILLAALLAIVGFVGVNVWLMNAELKSMHNTIDLIVQGRIRIPANPLP